jgi:DNA helicase II / ATP-dependent DNA helicase PcrA
MKDRRRLVSAFEAAWARQQTDEPGQPVPGLDQAFQNAFLGSLRWHKAMLVGEVVPIALSYLRNNPQASERRGYDHVLVDEYQDLNRAEQEVLNKLSAEANLAVIGDDDQSIYAFKWANPEESVSSTKSIRAPRMCSLLSVGVAPNES